MCGIAGFIASNNKIKHPDQLLRQMTDEIKHRGPDDEGHWHDIEGGVALGHRRLSIVDLSPLGHQPMVSTSRRYVIVYNGEVYNHLELRVGLEARGYKFKGHSDTETILACFEEYGIRNSIQKFNGMFAIAVWDKKERKLFLVRDRMGIKPLYYGTVKDTFIFASELNPIKQIPEFNNALNKDAMASYFRYNCIPAPQTIYRDIFKLNPGELLEFDWEQNKVINKSIYWSAIDQVKHGQKNLWDGSYDAAKDELEKLLLSSVNYRMLADVPLGAFLSGGVDSSLIVALMQAQSTKPVKTFTIGFTEQGYNEAHYAKEVARHLGTNHTELIVSPKVALDVIPKLSKLYDEPFADSSQIPTYLVSELAGRHVTVSLSGDGGDELFGGYNRHQHVPKVWKLISKYPLVLRKGIVRILEAVPTPFWNNAFYFINHIMPANKQFSRVGDNLLKIADILYSSSPEEMYKILCSHWKNPEELVIGAKERLTSADLVYDNTVANSITHKMMATDAVSYLPNDILTKVDRASMGVSLEARVPLLDHRVFEFAWSLPLEMKISNGTGKHILRDILFSYVPRNLIERPKAGFGIPLDTWLRNDLRDWAENLLSDQALNAHGLLNKSIIQKKWAEHISGKKNNQSEIWDVLMFQAWNETNG